MFAAAAAAVKNEMPEFTYQGQNRCQQQGEYIKKTKEIFYI